MNTPFALNCWSSQSPKFIQMEPETLMLSPVSHGNMSSTVRTPVKASPTCSGAS